MLLDYDNKRMAEEFNRYDDFNLSWGYIFVKKSGKWGVATKENKLCLPIVFDKIYRGNDCSYQKELPIVGEILTLNEKYVFNREFQIIMKVDLETRIYKYWEDIYQYVLEDGKIGYFNLQGKILVPAAYEFCELYDTFVCYGEEQNKKIMFFENYVVWDIGNQEAFEINENILVLIGVHFLKLVNTVTWEEYMYVTKEKIKSVEEVRSYDEGGDKIYAFVLKVDGKYGVIDLKCNVVVPFEYDDIFCGLYVNKNTSMKYYKVKKNVDSKGLYGLVDMVGTVIIDCEYEEIYQNEEGDWVFEIEAEIGVLPE